MGEEAGVGIEPPSQTRLLDHTLEVSGVVGVGVPGAGGVDAVFALILEGPNIHVRESVEQMWSRWGTKESKNSMVCPLMLNADEGLSSGVRAEFGLKW
jgi:phosphomevalonate kinase